MVHAETPMQDVRITRAESVFVDGDARPTAVRCGFKFRCTELGREFGLVTRRKFRKPRYSKVWGSFCARASLTPALDVAHRVAQAVERC